LWSIELEQWNIGVYEDLEEEAIFEVCAHHRKYSHFFFGDTLIGGFL
jgi:hypothetical protein